MCRWIQHWYMSTGTCNGVHSWVFASRCLAFNQLRECTRRETLMIITIFQHCCMSPRRFFVSMNTGGKRCLQVIQSSSSGKQSIFSDHVTSIDIICSDCSACCTRHGDGWSPGLCGLHEPVRGMLRWIGALCPCCPSTRHSHLAIRSPNITFLSLKHT